MAFQKMTTEYSKTSEDSFTITVEHDRAQSYSRAVSPAAVRSMNAAHLAQIRGDFPDLTALALSAWDYDATVTPGGRQVGEGRALTAYTYTVTQTPVPAQV